MATFIPDHSDDNHSKDIPHPSAFHFESNHVVFTRDINTFCISHDSSSGVRRYPLGVLGH